MAMKLYDRMKTLIKADAHGVVDALDGMVDRIRQEWGRPAALVVATGGSATLVGPQCRTVERVEPWLTLYGLALAGRHLAGERL
jgi:type III pantothenate kinase